MTSPVSPHTDHADGLDIRTATTPASPDHDETRAGPPTAAGRHPAGRRRGVSAETVLGATLPVVMAAGVFLVAFVHIHDVARWAGQPDWASWLIAASVELMALASVIEIRHRHRTGSPVRWPVTTLLAGVAMSGAGNLTAAGSHTLTGPPGFWVPVMALWPVVAFGLVAGLKATRPTSAPPVGTIPRSETTDDRSDRSDRPGPLTEDSSMPTGLPADLLSVGREVAAELARERRPLTRAALARGVRQHGHRCSTDRATLLLAALRAGNPGDVTSAEAAESSRPGLDQETVSTYRKTTDHPDGQR